jgi:hypothetical protein
LPSSPRKAGIQLCLTGKKHNHPGRMTAGFPLSRE